jgi:hypothetical protein
MENNNINNEEEILNTIKMEPILEKTKITEEPQAIKKKKMMNAVDYILIALIVIIIAIFVVVVIKL